MERLPIAKYDPEKHGDTILAYDPTWYDVWYPMHLNMHGKWVHWFNDLGPFSPTYFIPMPAPPEQTDE